MNPWQVWDCPFPWGEHPAVIISNAIRVEMKPQIVVLSCRTMRKSSSRDPVGCEALLDQADGMDWKTLCRCDLMFTIDKTILKHHRGEVSLERRREIAAKILQGLAIAGL
jgi:mRNA-degrading endonuclease toxin of MazEF toxin-antitoxin module